MINDIENPDYPTRGFVLGWHSLSNLTYRQLVDKNILSIKPKDFSIETPLVFKLVEKSKEKLYGIPFYIKK